LISTSDPEILELTESFETEVKQIKHNVYKLSWYMRGGVNAQELLCDTDLDDLGILHTIVKENIEFTKSTKMPFI
jgi:hypothetical protein|tara:strand:+ start:1149 stop:1373 length:225 start_codon:yes stop_codon:yes gene_type:complete